MILIGIICFLAALVPCALFLRNLRAYRAPEVSVDSFSPPSISVLIPARNEEANIRRALESVLANKGAALELVVLDDHSTDRTAAIVTEFASKDSRVRLETAPPLPQGWCGKQHACAALAARACFPWLVFMDADVRLAPDALVRMVTFVSRDDIALASGVPRQELGTFGEKLLIPLIHFVLLAFLPISRMRHSKSPAYAAGCGQLFIARADAYRACGGHAAIRASLHDGINLPRVFREHGFKTDLFDATKVAVCRMYASTSEVFAGLSKNAVEGLAAPRRILPVTLLLLAGQVLPFALLAMSQLTWTAKMIAGAAGFGALLPRVLGVRRFQQPMWSAFLHPAGILALLAIQWLALWRYWRGRPAKWRGRAYPRAATAALVFAAAGVLWAGNNSRPQIKDFELSDQHERSQRVSFPRTNLSFVLVADQKGSEYLEKWIQPVHARFGSNVAIMGVADVSAVPTALRGLVRRAFAKKLSYPVMLDWNGDVVRQFNPTRNTANVYVLATNGFVLRRWAGAADERKLSELEKELSGSGLAKR